MLDDLGSCLSGYTPHLWLKAEMFRFRIHQIRSDIRRKASLPLKATFATFYATIIAHYWCDLPSH